MLRFQEDQIRACSDRQRSAFVSEMAALVDDLSPALSATLGAEEKRQAVIQVRDVAREHGFTRRGPIAFWLDASLTLGFGFWSDPQYPEIRDLLERQRGFPEMTRAEALERAVNRFLGRSMGPEGAFYHSALLRLRELSRDPPELPDDDVEDRCLALLAQVYPQRAEVCGDDRLGKLTEQLATHCRKVFGLTDPASVATFVLFGFFAGHDFHRDPFLPWIARSLQRWRALPQAEAGRRLRRRCGIWMNAVVENNLRSVQ